MGEDLIDQVIAHGFLAQQVYSKTQFDNAKDTSQLLAAATDNANMVQVAIKARMIPYVEQLLEQRLRQAIDESDGQIALTFGNGKFVLVRVSDQS